MLVSYMSLDNVGCKLTSDAAAHSALRAIQAAPQHLAMPPRKRKKKAAAAKIEAVSYTHLTLPTKA